MNNSTVATFQEEIKAKQWNLLHLIRCYRSIHPSLANGKTFIVGFPLTNVINTIGNESSNQVAIPWEENQVLCLTVTTKCQKNFINERHLYY